MRGPHGTTLTARRHHHTAANPYRHIVRIRAPTSTRICFVLRSEAEALATGHVAVSKYCSSVTGMNRVLEA
jgi:hypothetical protein